LFIMLALTYLYFRDEKDPTLLFTHRRGETQPVARGEHEFGGDYMLGKLCRLEKRCGLNCDVTRSARRIGRSSSGDLGTRSIVSQKPTRRVVW
jgi:hypothetical protein